ncbi:transposase [Bradyrhizobium sp. RT4a]
MTLQRDLKRARIVLLAADGRSTRSIAKEVGVQPRIVSLWRHRYADHGLEGLQDKPRPGKQPIYTKATDKRILRLLDKPLILRPPSQQCPHCRKKILEKQRPKHILPK